MCDRSTVLKHILVETYLFENEGCGEDIQPQESVALNCHLRARKNQVLPVIRLTSAEHRQGSSVDRIDWQFESNPEDINQGSRTDRHGYPFPAVWLSCRSIHAGKL